MEIKFADERLALIETEGAAETGLPVAVIQAVRQRLSIIRAAPDMRTLRNWKSLGLQPGPDIVGHFVVWLPQWAMAIRIEEKSSVMTVVVTKIEQQLRGAVA